MKYFLDTEFYEDGSTIDLISIGAVCEDGREFYACNQDAKLHLVSDWVRDNVVNQLPHYSVPVWMKHADIARRLEQFILGNGINSKPEVWAYYADYDWITVCQLYGTMMGLPRGFPKFCMDLKQLSVHKGSPAHPKKPLCAHDAIIDARWNRDLYNFLAPLPWVNV